MQHRFWESHRARWLGIMIRHHHNHPNRMYLGPLTWLRLTLSWCVVGDWNRLRNIVLDDRGGGSVYDETVRACVDDLIETVLPHVRTLVCHTGPSGGVLVRPAIEALARSHGWLPRTGCHAERTVRIEWSGIGCVSTGDAAEGQSLGYHALCAAHNVELIVRDAADWMRNFQIHLAGQLSGNNTRAFLCRSLRVDLRSGDYQWDKIGIVEILAAIPSLRRLEFSSSIDHGAPWHPFGAAYVSVNHHLECLRLSIPGRGSGNLFIDTFRRCMRSFPGLRQLTLDLRGFTIADADLHRLIAIDNSGNRHRLQHTTMLVSAHPELTAVGVGCWRDWMRKNSKRTTAVGCSACFEVIVSYTDTHPDVSSWQRWRSKWPFW